MALFLNHIAELNFFSPSEGQPSISISFRSPTILLTLPIFFLIYTEEGIFLIFPQSTRRVVASELVKALLSKSTSSSTVSTSVHVRIILESLGQAFSLPLEDAMIIDSCLELYKRWILEEHARPEPISNDYQFFVREMLKHMSKVFEIRPGQLDPFDSKLSGSTKEFVLPDHINTHVKLCNEVLDIMRQLSRNLVSINLILCDHISFLCTSAPDHNYF